MAKQVYNNYGVNMSGMQDMMYGQYVQTLDCGMNTKSKKERFDIAEEWLKRNALSVLPK